LHDPSPLAQEATPSPFHEFRFGEPVPAGAHPPDFDFDAGLITLGPWPVRAGAARAGAARASDAGLPDEASVAQAVGLKRKAVDKPDDSEQHEGTLKTDPPKDTRGQAKSSGKKLRYSDFEGVEHVQLPDFSQTSLSFSNHHAALASFQAGLRSMEDAFVPADEDGSIPQDDAERQTAVRMVLGAIRDTTHAKNSDSSGFQSRWIPDAPKGYSALEMEVTAWEIVVSTLHTLHATSLTTAGPD
jgi:hypothetical protein